ncbi:amidase [Stappia sp. 22II-S9-Z10]|nr:amidase [Stappia sp. 22II-S9-Z10]
MNSTVTTARPPASGADKAALGAFCRDNDVTLAPTGDGPLSGLTFAVKDVYDIEGTTCANGQPLWLATHGPATATAPAVARVLAAGASCEGRTICDEMCYSLTGENVHYGTPLNPAAPDCVPGGSSSGSASAVAGGVVDFALGTDCGGSIRTPASYCGLWGMRPTHDRIPLTGIVPFAPSFDTAGWFARDAATLALVGAVLMGDDAPAAPLTRLVVADDAFAALEPAVAEALAPALARVHAVLGSGESVTVADDGLASWSATFRVVQGGEIWVNCGPWVEANAPSFGPGVADRFATAAAIPADAIAKAKAERAAIVKRIGEVVTAGTVLVMPTVPRTAPPKGGEVADVEVAYRHAAMNLLCVAGLAGLPQISMPLASHDGKPLGLSIIGPRGTDRALLALAEAIAAA